MIRRQDVKGFVKRKPLWLTRHSVSTKYENMPRPWSSNGQVLSQGAQSAHDTSIRELLDKLADAEDEHERLAHKLGETILTKAARESEDPLRALVRAAICAAGLAGLMDGSVSTLAPLFAAAFARITHGRLSSSELLASMALASPWHLPRLCLMTARLLDGYACAAWRGLWSDDAAGGLGHTPPYLIPDFSVATFVSVWVVAVELPSSPLSGIGSWIHLSLQRRFKSWSGVFWCSARALRLGAHKIGPTRVYEKLADVRRGARLARKSFSAKSSNHGISSTWPLGPKSLGSKPWNNDVCGKGNFARPGRRISRVHVARSICALMPGSTF